MEYEYPQKQTFTHQNACYRNHIDHIISNQYAKNNITECNILLDNLNCSDHNPVSTTLKVKKNLNISNELNEQQQQRKNP